MFKLQLACTSPPSMRRLHSVISLLTVGMLSVFCFSFQFFFFHAQRHTEEVLCIPRQLQYVPPTHPLTPRHPQHRTTYASLSLRLLHRYIVLSSSFLLLLLLFTLLFGTSSCFETLFLSPKWNASPCSLRLPSGSYSIIWNHLE